jgi:hypothetical protein
MTTTGPFDTGYIGAHRWHVDQERGTYTWTCVCGDTGRVTGNLSFALHAFGEHAYRKLEEAAVSLVLEPLPHTRQVINSLFRQAGEAEDASNNDRANILMLAHNRRFQEAQEADEDIYKNLRWTAWPEQTSEGRGVEIDDAYANYWLHVSPRSAGSWAWETWLINPRTGDETKLAEGTTSTQDDAQRAAWDALVLAYQAQEDEEPF